MLTAGFVGNITALEMWNGRRNTSNEIFRLR
jgi:hypothetical protein